MATERSSVVRVPKAGELVAADLRHTAACLWLARGVDPGTVQAWMGHESIATTNRYLHFLGTSADQAGLERLNDPGRAPQPGSQRGPERAAQWPGVSERTLAVNIPVSVPGCEGQGMREPAGQVDLRVLRPGVELRGFEPLTFSLRTRRATNCAMAPER